MEPDQKPAVSDGSSADAQGADYNDEGHATDLASPDRDRNLLTRVSCWAFEYFDQAGFCSLWFFP